MSRIREKQDYLRQILVPNGTPSSATAPLFDVLFFDNCVFDGAYLDALLDYIVASLHENGSAIVQHTLLDNLTERDLHAALAERRAQSDLILVENALFSATFVDRAVESFRARIVSDFYQRP